MQELIVLEGIDGVGKTTLAAQVTQRVLASGRPCIWYDRSPHKRSLVTPAARDWIKNRATVEESFHLYIQSIAYQSVIITGLLENACVVMDRYVDSILAHHLALGLAPTLVEYTRGLPLQTTKHVFHVTLPEPLRIERLRGREDAMAEDYMSAGDASTLLGRKRLWFSKLISAEIPNTDAAEAVADRIFERVFM